MQKVIVGMSGGVDSSAAAKILMDRGYEAEGCTLSFLGDETDRKNISDAAEVCAKLGIKHHVLDLTREFRENVIEPFVQSYIRGETPNPCIECNKRMKFGFMIKAAEKLGFDFIATGHYAVREYDSASGRYLLKRPSDRSKDQTYVLYGITQHQLSKTLFPLGGFDKPSIRRIAEDSGLITSHKPDSQDICFVPDKDYAAFIRKHTGIEFPPGDFLNTKGEVIGCHKGVINYTIGQRRGTGIALGVPAYVTDKNAEKNTVTIGGADDLMKKEITVADLNLISAGSLPDELRVTAKVRYGKNEAPALVRTIGEGVVRVDFDTPQRAPAKGQAAVFYDGDTVIGGGTIIG